MTRSGWWGILVMAAALVPASALAQPRLQPFTGVATVHLGTTAGGEAGASASIGGSVAVVESNGWGVEVDVGHGFGDDDRAGRAAVQSYMVNFTGIRPRGRLRPFFVAGAGALRARTCSVDCTRTLSWSDWGYSAGAGAHYLFDNWMAIRADVRYFGTLADHPDPARTNGFGFWRVAAGISVLWGEM